MHFDFQQGSLIECLITKGEIMDGQGQGRAKPEGPTEGAGMAGRGPGPRGVAAGGIKGRSDLRWQGR